LSRRTIQVISTAIADRRARADAHRLIDSAVALIVRPVRSERASETFLHNLAIIGMALTVLDIVRWDR